MWWQTSHRSREKGGWRLGVTDRDVDCLKGESLASSARCHQCDGGEGDDEGGEGRHQDGQNQHEETREKAAVTVSTWTWMTIFQQIAKIKTIFRKKYNLQDDKRSVHLLYPAVLGLDLLQSVRRLLCVLARIRRHMVFDRTTPWWVGIF